MGGAGGARVIVGPACLGTSDWSLWRTIVRGPDEKEGPSMSFSSSSHRLQGSPMACESMPGGSAPGQSYGTGAHQPAPWTTVGQASTGAPPARDAVPQFCSLLRNPCGTSHPQGYGSLFHQHPSPPYLHMLTCATAHNYHTCEAGYTYTSVAYTARPCHHQDTHANSQPSHMLTWAICRYDHTVLSHV